MGLDQDPTRSAAAPDARTCLEWLERCELEYGAVDWIIGSDEAGYGTWAGDLVVAAVATRRSWSDAGVTDSKALSPAARRNIVRRYRNAAGMMRVVFRVPPQVIDEEGVFSVAIRLHNKVHEALAARLLAVDPDCSRLHIVDGLENARSQLDAGLVPLAKADTFVPSVSLASCFAKVVQCELMNRAAKRYPGYGFEKHCGYGTPQHREALIRLGVTAIHRKSYRPIRDLLSTDGTPADCGG